MPQQEWWNTFQVARDTGNALRCLVCSIDEGLHILETQASPVSSTAIKRNVGRFNPTLSTVLP